MTTNNQFIRKIGFKEMTVLISIAELVLKNNEAKDSWSVLNLSIKHAGRSHKLQFNHIFLKSLLRDANYSTKEINEYRVLIL